MIKQGLDSNPFKMHEQFKNKDGMCEIEQMFFLHYYNLAITSIKWSGLPKEIEPFFINDTMFWRGKGIMIKDPVIEKFAFMKCNLTGMMDIYNIPDERYAYANTGYIEKYNKEDSVILWDTPLTMPLFYTVSIYAKAMANLWNTRDMNIFAQRTPVVFAMSEGNRLSYENIINKYQQYIPVIKVDDYMNLDKIKVLKTDAPYLVDKLQSEMRVLECELLSKLGIENNPIDKKERSITGEVEGNNGVTEMYRKTRLVTKERFCNQINKMWGLNASVEFNSELYTNINVGLEYGLGGGSNDGVE